MNLYKTNTRWLVHSQSTFGVRTSHGQLGHTRLTTAQLGGSHHLPPYSILCSSPWGPHPNGFLFRDCQIGILKFPQLGFRDLEVHNLACKPSITMRPKEKLQPLSRAFQQYVTCRLHTRKSGRFLTFNGWESNCQFDSRPFFCPLLVFQMFKQAMRAHFRHLCFNRFPMI